jgi:hypothetical protein
MEASEDKIKRRDLAWWPDFLSHFIWMFASFMVWRRSDWLCEFNIQRAAGFFHPRFVIVNDDNHDASE